MKTGNLSAIANFSSISSIMLHIPLFALAPVPQCPENTLHEHQLIL
ncbi:hypothetical protein [Nostoc sp. ATCC 53789]|nr:hypothetical protein [Nostoc sp. ATCC 53789]QHG18219.1 hypothetical protein GJB62_21040 [Nostoc sp. ATCC 53789]